MCYSCYRVCMPEKGLLYVRLSGSLLTACVSFVCWLPSDLSILSCLLREGWIPLCEQYPNASLDFVKVFTSSSCTSWEGNNTAFHKHQMMAKLHTQIKNWTSAGLAQVGFPLKFPTTNDCPQRNLCRETNKKPTLHQSTEMRSLTFQLCYCTGHSSSARLLLFLKLDFVSDNHSSDHASEVQVTMMLTESCKLRGLHHR